MKSKLASVLTILMHSCYANAGESVDISTPCDQKVTRQLRYGHTYTLDDTLSSKWKYIGVQSIETFYSEKYDYNNSATFPNFGFTEKLKSLDYIVGPGARVNSVVASQSYPINYHPEKRSPNNLVVKYRYKYYSSQSLRKNKKDWEGPSYFTSCVNYEITWCGDGVIDKEDGEECEFNDTENNKEQRNCTIECKIIPNT